MLFAVMIALHYVFNVTYSNKIEATMVFIQRLFFNINDNQKYPQGFVIDPPRKERCVKEKANIYNHWLNAI